MRLKTLICVLLATAATPAAAAGIEIANRDTQGLLRAIQAATDHPDQPRHIVLAAGGLYTLDAAQAGQLGLPALRGTLRIDGRGAELRRYSGEALTLIQVDPGAEVHITGLTLAEGSLGAVRNFGQLVLENVVISDNSGETARAIVVNHGDLTIRDSRIAHNGVHSAGRDAGTIVNFGNLSLSQSRIDGNSLSRRYPSLATATILNHGMLTLDAVGFSDNDVTDGFGGLASSAVLNLVGGRVQGAGEIEVTEESAQLAAR